jgi:hypothetical protein
MVSIHGTGRESPNHRRDLFVSQTRQLIGKRLDMMAEEDPANDRVLESLQVLPIRRKLFQKCPWANGDP